MIGGVFVFGGGLFWDYTEWCDGVLYLL